MAEPLEAILGRLLFGRGLWLGVAESCTGGLLGNLVTDVPGSSAYFKGGVIAYADDAKIRLLGVLPETIRSFGAVSEQTVLEMARGVRQALACDLGISVSGIAGPSGGSAEKPVGTTWIGLSAPDGETARLFVFDGGRSAVKERAALQALQIAIDYLTLQVRRT